MSAQAENIERVRSKIESSIINFALTHIDKPFHMEDLTRHVKAQIPDIAPDSPGRILRLLRRQRALDYEVVNRRQSLYRITKFGRGLI